MKKSELRQMIREELTEGIFDAFKKNVKPYSHYRDLFLNGNGQSGATILPRPGGVVPTFDKKFDEKLMNSAKNTEFKSTSDIDKEIHILQKIVDGKREGAKGGRPMSQGGAAGYWHPYHVALDLIDILKDKRNKL